MTVWTVKDDDFRAGSIHNVIKTRQLSVSIKLGNYNIGLSDLGLKVQILKLVLDEIVNSNFGDIDSMKVTFEHLLVKSSN